MPHRCMNCGKVYEDDSEELISGCECGSSLFMYEQETEEEEISSEERAEVREDIEEMVEEGFEEKENIKFEFDLDSIIVEEEGVYNINISKLLKEIPLVIRKSEGVYHVHLPSAFKPGKRDLDPEELDIG
ncbi:MAG: Zn-ribbon domain-containing protein [Candidatus Nanohaloarchaea archaeon]